MRGIEIGGVYDEPAQAVPVEAAPRAALFADMDVDGDQGVVAVGTERPGSFHVVRLHGLP